MLLVELCCALPLLFVVCCLFFVCYDAVCYVVVRCLCFVAGVVVNVVVL